MISFGLIQKFVTDIEEGWTTPELAAKKIAAGCRCGVFIRRNPYDYSSPKTP